MLVALILTISFQSQAMFRQASRVAAAASRSFKPALAPRTASSAAHAAMPAAHAAAPVARQATRTFAASAFAPRIAHATKKPLAGKMALFAGLTATMAGAGIAKAEGAEQSAKPGEQSKSKVEYDLILKNSDICAQDLEIYGVNENNIHEWWVAETWSGKGIVVITTDNKKIAIDPKKPEVKAQPAVKVEQGPALIFKDGKFQAIYENMKTDLESEKAWLIGTLLGGVIVGGGFGGTSGAIIAGLLCLNDGHLGKRTIANGTSFGTAIGAGIFGLSALSIGIHHNVKIKLTLKESQGLDLRGAAAKNNTKAIDMFRELDGVENFSKNIIKQDQHGLNSVMIASAMGSLDACKVLLEAMPKEYQVSSIYGGLYISLASINKMDKEGRTALDLARQGGHKNIEELLLANGAKSGAAAELSFMKTIKPK